MQLLTFLASRDSFQLGSQLYRKDKARHDRVLDAHASALAAAKELVDAGILWAQCGQTAKALDAFRRCGHWRRALALTAAADRAHLALDLAQDLLANDRYRCVPLASARTLTR